MTGLIDCNNFFVSCERVFNPRLRDIPIAVLSNNDGCIVALSNEAKTLGLRRGDPYFKVKDICDRNNVAILSGNHRLYGDISSRVMATIESVAGEVEVYSVDEAFINFDEWKDEECIGIGREIVRRIRRNTGIPTSLGLSSTKTLAKIASHFAKKYPVYRCVCTIDNEYRRRRALELTEVHDVWGIGRRLAQRLLSYGITTAAQFADMSEEDILKISNITTLRTWRELHGLACINLDSHDIPQKQMCYTRTFATDITALENLEGAISMFATNITRKLRDNKLATQGVGVFLRTNSHHPERPQYYGNTYIQLDEPGNDTIIVTETALAALRQIFRKGLGYKRAGIFLPELVNEHNIQPSLFGDRKERIRSRRLMSVIDSINASSPTHDNVHLASYVPIDACTRCEKRSPYYTSRLSDIIKVKTSHGLQTTT